MLVMIHFILGWQRSQLVFPIQAVASPVYERPFGHSGKPGEDDDDHQQYDDLYQGVVNLEEAKANVLGGEVALWTEQADGFSMMTRS